MGLEIEKSSENQRIIFVEGLSCSGKTSVLKTLSNREVSSIFKKWPSNLRNPPLEFFLTHDEDKLKKARESKGSTVLVDRGPISTLTFYSVMEEQVGVSAYPVYKWYIENLEATLYRPNFYVFLDVPPSLSIKRAKESNRIIDDKNMWLHFPDRIEYWYDKLLAVFEHSTPIHRIDGTKSIDEVASDFNKLLSTLSGENG